MSRDVKTTVEKRGEVGNVRSKHRPLDGQSHRSSENFGIWPSQDADGLRWEIAGGGSTRVRFNVKKDVPRGRDPVLYERLHNGSITRRMLGGRFYIADPVNAYSSFDVNVYEFDRADATDEEREIFDALEDVVIEDDTAEANEPKP